MFGISFFTSLLKVRPSINGIFMSVIRISGRLFRIRGSAISPSAASPTSSNPYFSQGTILLMFSLMITSSSTKKVRSIFLRPFCILYKAPNQNKIRALYNYFNTCQQRKQVIFAGIKIRLSAFSHTNLWQISEILQIRVIENHCLSLFYRRVWFSMTY